MKKLKYKAIRYSDLINFKYFTLFSSLYESSNSSIFSNKDDKDADEFFLPEFFSM